MSKPSQFPPTRKPRKAMRDFMFKTGITTKHIRATNKREADKLFDEWLLSDMHREFIDWIRSLKTDTWLPRSDFAWAAWKAATERGRR